MSAPCGAELSGRSITLVPGGAAFLTVFAGASLAAL